MGRVWMQPTSYPFGKEIQTYRQSEVITPFQPLGQAFDKPVGKYVQKAYMWRLVFFISSTVAFIFSLILISFFNATPYHIITEQITNKGYLKSPPALLGLRYTLPTPILAEFVKQSLFEPMHQLEGNSYISLEAKEAIKEEAQWMHQLSANKVVFDKFVINGMSFAGELVDDKGNPLANMTGMFSQTTINSPDKVKTNPLGIYINRLSIQRL